MISRVKDGVVGDNCEASNDEASLLLLETEILEQHKVLVGNIDALICQYHHFNMGFSDLATHRRLGTQSTTASVILKGSLGWMFKIFSCCSKPLHINNSLIRRKFPAVLTIDEQPQVIFRILGFASILWKLKHVLWNVIIQKNFAFPQRCRIHLKHLDV